MTVPPAAEPVDDTHGLLARPAPAERGDSIWRLDVRGPILTTSLLLVLLLIFAAEQAFGVDASPGLTVSPSTLNALGALDASLALQRGEWWRIATAPFLHASLTHILGNGIVFLLVGAMLERLIGRGWLAVVFLVSALGGAVGALALNPPDLPTVGASGAVLGLLSAAFVLSFHPACHGHRVRLRLMAALLAIPSLIPAPGAPGATVLVDFSSHFGGAAAGAFMGVLLQAIWPETAPRPLFADVAAALALAGFAATAAAFVLVAQHYPAYGSPGALLIRDADMPKTVAEGAARSADLVALYPHDPRAHLYRAAYFEQLQDWPDAEVEVRTAIADPQTATLSLSPPFRLGMRYELAMLLEAQGRIDDAKIAAEPVCAAPAAATPAGDRSTLDRAGLCDGSQTPLSG